MFTTAFKLRLILGALALAFFSGVFVSPAEGQEPDTPDPETFIIVEEDGTVLECTLPADSSSSLGFDCIDITPKVGEPVTPEEPTLTPTTAPSTTVPVEIGEPAVEERDPEPEPEVEVDIGEPAVIVRPPATTDAEPPVILALTGPEEVALLVLVGVTLILLGLAALFWARNCRGVDVYSRIRPFVAEGDY